MNAITIHNLSPRALESIAERAREHRKSVEDEAAAILERAVRAGHRSDGRQRIADRIAAMTPKGVAQSDSTWLVREDRDR